MVGKRRSVMGVGNCVVGKGRSVVEVDGCIRLKRQNFKVFLLT